MGSITYSIEVNVPVQTVYNQWTRFEKFPRFMEGVEEVRRDGPNRLFWKARIGGQEKQWEAEITEQVPNARIVWRSVDGTSNRGAVTFEELDVSQTRVTLTMHYEPEGFFEQAGDALGIPLGEVAENLNRLPGVHGKWTRDRCACRSNRLGSNSIFDRTSHERGGHQVLRRID